MCVAVAQVTVDDRLMLVEAGQVCGTAPQPAAVSRKICIPPAEGSPCEWSAIDDPPRMVRDDQAVWEPLQVGRGGWKALCFVLFCVQGTGLHLLFRWCQ